MATACAWPRWSTGHRARITQDTTLHFMIKVPSCNSMLLFIWFLKYFYLRSHDGWHCAECFQSHLNSPLNCSPTIIFDVTEKSAPFFQQLEILLRWWALLAFKQPIAHDAQRPFGRWWFGAFSTVLKVQAHALQKMSPTSTWHNNSIMHKHSSFSSKFYRVVV